MYRPEIDKAQRDQCYTCKGTGTVAPVSDTPETDAAIVRAYPKAPAYVHVHVARKLERERNQLRDAIREAAARFDRVKWGWDGHCGSADIIALLEDVIPENDQAEPRSNQS